MDSDIQLYGDEAPTKRETPKQACQFGNFSVPDNAHIKFGTIYGDSAKPEVWELAQREDFRTR